MSFKSFLILAAFTFSSLSYASRSFLSAEEAFSYELQGKNKENLEERDPFKTLDEFQAKTPKKPLKRAYKRFKTQLKKELTPVNLLSFGFLAYSVYSALQAKTPLMLNGFKLSLLSLSTLFYLVDSFDSLLSDKPSFHKLTVMSLPQMKDKNGKILSQKTVKERTYNFFEMYRIKNLKKGYFLKPVTSVFLHENFLHLAANMFFLMSLPKTSLLSFTGKAFLKLFSLAYLSSSLAYVFEGPCLGFSGVLSGVLAADYSDPQKAFKSLFLSSLFPGVSKVSHFSGFILGLSMR